MVFHFLSRGSYFSPLLLASLRLIPPMAYIAWLTVVGFRGAPLWLWSWDLRLGRRWHSVASNKKSLKWQTNKRRLQLYFLLSLYEYCTDIFLRTQYHHANKRNTMVTHPKIYTPAGSVISDNFFCCYSVHQKFSRQKRESDITEDFSGKFLKKIKLFRRLKHLAPVVSNNG